MTKEIKTFQTPEGNWWATYEGAIVAGGIEHLGIGETEAEAIENLKREGSATDIGTAVGEDIV